MAISGGCNKRGVGKISNVNVYGVTCYTVIDGGGEKANICIG